LDDIEAINYRQEIMRELESEALFEYIKSFSEKMHTVRVNLTQAEKLHYKYEQERIFLDAASAYGDAVNCLLHDLSLIDLKSRGLLDFREYLRNYAESNSFTSLLTATNKLIDDLSLVKYCLLIKADSIQVRK
jgi:DNA mismatch repair protein MutS